MLFSILSFSIIIYLWKKKENREDRAEDFKNQAVIFFFIIVIAGFADALAASPGISPFLTGLTSTLASGTASPAANAAMLSATAAALRLPHVGVLNISPVVLVSNLDENVWTILLIVILFYTH